MKTPDSSIVRAWFSRNSRPSPARVPRDRLDLVLPSGWPDGATPLTWRWQRRGAGPESGETQDLARLPPGAERAMTCVWTPAADTMLTNARLPTKSPRKIMQALPYALEDRLLGDPESLHFAWRPESDGSLSVAVTARTRLQTWMERLTRAKLRPSALCPSTLLVPWAVDSWSLAFVGNEILVRTGPVSGFVCPAAGDQPPALLVAAAQEALKQANPPDVLVVFHATSGFPLEAWSKKLGLPLRKETGSLWDKLSEPGAPLNLLQGQYEPSSAIGESIRPYRVALILLGLWLVSSLGYDLSDWWKLRREHAAIRQEMSQILTSSFPETRTIIDPAAQMQKAVEQLLARRGKGDQELLPMLSKVANTKRNDSTTRLRSLRYADQALILELTWKTPSNPEAWKAALESAGLHAEVLSLTPHTGEVEGRIRLTTVRPARSGI
jgi:general secretion pathway protein L